MFDPIEINLADPGFKSDPYPGYRRMRDEASAKRQESAIWLFAFPDFHTPRVYEGAYGDGLSKAIEAKSCLNNWWASTRTSEA